MIWEGSIAHGRLTHELVETAQDWELRPIERNLCNDKRLLFGFGIPFLVFFSCLLIWIFHYKLNIGLAVSVLRGIIITVVCGGTALLLIGILIRFGYSQLCHLIIPLNNNDLELELREEPKLQNRDVTAEIKSLVTGATKMQRLIIQRNSLAAVQLCPWKFDFGTDRQCAYAVQGVLVLVSSHTGEYKRIPLLITSDFAGAAKLIQQLAQVLKVPYLFYGDAMHWKAENIRAKNRPPLKSGGWQS